jgi:hypothetical protein
MNKKFKITYWVAMALNAVVCVVYIITARYFGATLAGVNTLWLFACYLLVNTVCRQETLIGELATREKIHHQQFAKMRKRAQNAEIKLQQMIDDTPARGKDGRYIKREN